MAGALRLGQWFRAVSPAVIKGMLAGIGVLIFASQFHVMVDDSPKKNGVQNLLTIPQAIAKGLPLPEPSTAAQRERRTMYLKEVGTLHARQTEVLEAIAEAVPKDADKAFEVSAPLQNRLVATQEQVTADVRTVAEQVQKNHFAKTNTGESAMAAEAALAESEAALDMLRAHDVPAWLESQCRAAASLKQLAGTLKSHEWAAKIGLLTIVSLLAWQGFVPKRLRRCPRRWSRSSWPRPSRRFGACPYCSSKCRTACSRRCTCLRPRSSTITPSAACL